MRQLLKMRIMATALTLVALGSFLLPFFALSTVRGRERLIDYAGLELLTGTTFQQPLRTGDVPKLLRPVACAWAVFLGVLIAGTLLWSGKARARAVGIGAGAIATLAGVALFFMGEAAIARTIPDHLQATPLGALWVPALSASMLLALHCWPLKQENAPAEAGAFEAHEAE
jgi:hypothetical protein